MSELNEAHAKTLGLTTTTRGVFVRQIFEGSPAQEAGLESGDVIQKIDDKVIASPKEVQEVVKSHKVNEKVSFLVLRGATPKTLEVTIGQYPDLAPSSGPGSETKPDSGAQPKVQPE
jgi:S1-C subfamily serine protease